MCQSDLDVRFRGDYRELLSVQDAFLFISNVSFILFYLLFQRYIIYFVSRMNDITSFQLFMLTLVFLQQCIALLIIFLGKAV